MASARGRHPLNTAILLICILLPVLAASMFYISDRGAAEYAGRASPALADESTSDSDADISGAPEAGRAD